MTSLLLLMACLQAEDPPVPPPAKPDDPEIVIIGQRREGDILDVPSAVTVVTAEQIRESGALDIVDVVKRQPGFFSQGQNRGGYDQIVDLRGYNNGAGNGQRVLVLVDGRKTNDVVSSATDWATIPLGNVERIEIVRGPAAALYGDTALAGVINVITRKGGGETTGRVSTTAGGWNTIESLATVTGGKGGVVFDVHAGVEHTDGFRDHSGYRATRGTFRFEIPIDDGTLAFVKVGRYQDSRERPGSLSKAEIAASGRKASVPAGFPSEQDLEEGHLDIGVEHEVGALGELSLFLNHTESERDFNSGGFEIFDDSEISMLQLKHVVRPESLEKTLTITSGLDLSSELGDSDSGFTGSFDESEYHRRMVGVYSHVEVRPTDFLYLTGSLRYDRALLDLDRDIAPFGYGETVDRQRAFDQWSPHAGVTVKVLDPLSVYASYGRTFKYPTRDELLGFFATNPDLDPERAHVTETGVRFRSSDWGSASVTLFRMQVEDEIFFDPDFPFSTSFGALFGHNLNFDEVVHQGVETEARVTPFPWLELFGTHTFTRATITESDDPNQEGKTYPVTPKLMGTLGATGRYEGATLTVSGRYVGGRYLVNDYFNAFPRMESYWMMDLHASYGWQSFKIFASVFNAGDREVFDSGGTNLRFNPAPGRSGLVGGELTF